MKHKVSKKVISIDFGNKYLKFAVGSFDGANISVDKVFSKEIEPNIIDNGIILDEQKLAQIIQKTISKYNIKAKDCYGYVYGTDIIKKDILVPAILSEKDMDDLVATEISQILPIDIDNYVVRYKIVSDVEEKDGTKKFMLSCAVMNKQTVESYRKVIKMAKLKPVSLDLTTSAVENLIKYIVLSNSNAPANVKDEIAKGTICMAEVNSYTCSINIFKGGKLHFSRLVKSSGISDEDFAVLSTSNDISEITSSDTFEAFNETLSEINMVFRYYTNHNRTNKLDEVFVFGDLCRLNGFDKYALDVLQICVNKIDALNGIVDIKEDDLTMYINAIGGLIRW